MGIHIRLLNETNIDTLYTFECRNREFFETLVPSRGDDFYQKDFFKKSFHALLIEQLEETSFFYLIFNDKGDIIGRINIVDIDHETRSATLGYRIGEAFLKQGIASSAVNLILEEVKLLNLTTLNAKTTINNIGSQKVLENNHFKCLGEERSTFIMSGQEVVFINYVWELE